MEEIIRGLSEEQLQEWLYRFQLDHFLEEFDSEESRRTLLGLWRSINTDREQTVECVEQLRDFRKKRDVVSCENDYTLSDFETKNLPGGRLLLVKEKDSVYCFDKNGDLDMLLHEKKNPFTRTPLSKEILNELEESKRNRLYSLEVEELEDELDQLFFGKDYSVLEIKVTDLKAETEKLTRALELGDYSYEASLVPSFATDFDREQYLLYSPTEEWKGVMMSNISRELSREQTALEVLKAINLNIQINEEPNMAVYVTSLHLKNLFNRIDLENESNQERRDQLIREIDVNEQYIDPRYEPMYSLSSQRDKWFERIQSGEYNLSQVPENLIDREMSLAAVRQHEWVLEFVPEDLRDREMYLTAVQNGWALKDVPVNLIDREMGLAAVQSDGDALRYVPKEIIDRDISLAAVQNDGTMLEWVPEHLVDRDISLAAVQNDGTMLEWVPEHLVDRDISLAAVQQNGKALQHVPKELIDRKISLAAVRQHGWALRYVPEELIDREICLAAVQKDGDALYYVPWELRDHDISLAAVENDRYALAWVPERLIDRVKASAGIYI